MKAPAKIYLVLFLFLFGCASKDQKNTLEKELVGEWHNIYLKVTLNHGTGGEAEKIMECDSSNWETMLQMKPIHTFFKGDGSYRSEYHTLGDSLFQTITGTWKISNDTLIMNQQKPDPASYKLKTSVHNGIAQFEGMLDFDRDGKMDDRYLGKQRKQ